MKRLYAVRDAQLEAYGPVLEMRTDGEAVRAFMDEVMRGDGMISKHPDDYCLFRIGEFDERSGALVAEVQPVPVMQGNQVRELKAVNHG